MIKTVSTLALGLAISLPSAYAAPFLSLTLQEAGFSAITESSGTGLVSIDNTSYDDFVLNTVTGIGSPYYKIPGLDLQTVNITTPNLTTTHTLTIELTETGLSGVPNPSIFGNSFTGILNGVTSEAITTYIDPSNTAYGTAHELASNTFTAQGSDAFNKNVKISPGSLFSETEVIVAVFGKTTSNPDSLNSSVLISSAVPEPASLALIGVGLLGLAFARKRRSR